MTIRKGDSDQIEAHLEALKAEKWLGPAQTWWPNFLFRVDGLEAASRILNNGELLSRNAAIAANVLLSDAASPVVIAATSDRWKSYVRLYFRPLTPTQYHNEGFRRPSEYGLGSRCPAPVVMLFDAKAVLTQADTIFSNGNLAANAATGNDAAFLAQIPFQLVYHNTWMEPQDTRTIVFHRHAEVIVPDRLSLDQLRFIGCRSQAEYESLLFLLDPGARKRWSQKIGLGTKANLHFRRWTFVEQAVLEESRAVFRFNPSTASPGPFNIRVNIKEEITGKTFFWETTSFIANTELTIDLKAVSARGGYAIKVLLDDCLAYAGRYGGIDVIL